VNVANVGIFGGDDGLSVGLTAAELDKAALMLGLKMKSVLIRREKPVSFLARLYTPDVWDGNPNSCCDIKRQISKLHLCTQHSSLKPTEVLLAKTMALYLSDRNTPILGQIAEKAMLVHFGHKFTRDDIEQLYLKTQTDLLPWHMRTSIESQYPNQPNETYHDIIHRDLPEFDLGILQEFLGSVNHLDQMLHMPMCCAAENFITPTQTVAPTEKDQILRQTKAMLLAKTTQLNANSSDTPLPLKAPKRRNNKPPRANTADAAATSARNKNRNNPKGKEEKQKASTKVEH
jgi:hypothetical protein